MRESASTAVAPRARRRPLAVVALWALRGLGGWVATAPLRAALAGTGASRRPAGDFDLLAADGWLLLEVIGTHPGPLLEALRATLLGIVVIGWALLLPVAALHHALAAPTSPNAAELARAAVQSFGRFSVVSALGVLAAAAAVGAGLTLWIPLLEPLRLALDERRGELVWLSLGLWLPLVIGVTRLLMDLAHAEIALGERRVLAAITGAWTTLRHRTGQAFAAWASRSLAATTCMLLGGYVAVAVLGGGPEGWRVVAGLAATQGSLLVATGLGASWLARAHGLVLARRTTRCRAGPGADLQVHPQAARGDAAA